MSSATNVADKHQNFAPVDGAVSAVPDVMMKAAGSHPDATMSGAAPQSQQLVEMDEHVKVASNDAKDDTVDEVDDKKAKYILIQLLLIAKVSPPLRSLLGLNRSQKSFVPSASSTLITRTYSRSLFESIATVLIVMY